MNRIVSLRADLARQWSGNPRLRMGVGVILGIAAAYLATALFAQRERLQDRFAERSRYLHRLEALADERHWPARAEEARRLRAALEASMAEAAGTGIAQAELQTWIRDAGSAFVPDLRVQTQPPQRVEGSQVWRVPVVVSGSAPPERVLQLLRRIEGRADLVVVEQATILNRDNKTFSLTVASLVRLQEVAP